MSEAPETARLLASLRRKAEEGARLREAFFAAEGEAIVACAQAMAAAFSAGARLYCMGNGGSHCDAQHLAVEFVHPIYEKRAPLPAQALGLDPAWLSAIGNDEDFSLAYARQLERWARAGDIALGISTSGRSSNVARGLRHARAAGLLTVAFSGRDGGPVADAAEHAFVVPSYSTHRIQEVHEALVHLLWDTIHLLRGEEDHL